MSGKPKLVIGANGFLGSHVTRLLVEDGHDVRVMVRPTANTRAIDDLEVTRFQGDIFDTATVREAMDGCDDVYYCVVDTRAWLRDPAPLFRTNVEGLRNVLDVAKELDLHRFVFTSTYASVDRRHGHVASEADRIGARKVTPYVQSRVQAEDLVMRYVADYGLPAVAMCVSTTYGSGDWGRTPHGAFIAGAVFGKLPFQMSGIQLEVVGVDDAARAMILAAERGRNGEKYLISERMMALSDVVRIAADEAGVRPPQRSIPVPVLYALGAFGSLRARLTGKDAELSLDSVRMMRAEAPVDHSKAVRELGWKPRPVEESIREAARFWAGMRKAAKKAAAPE
ncbi:MULTISPECIES: NAD-dependent epimerase/dehydratase family protein [unclassified Mycobacterium]|uniref:NAD-dependent epimerase/dehydratase family protein n=1 Tax=unclassified Mycobacterium TaxID=2642494 RepID=UPI0027406AB0|nr:MULTISPECIES: NAD-dependent epimerase/dehydratase family protein [unclassified Mycobacterium]MDP7704541.1 NAD-dependent epimerase/dehydratase family protein [Mycobacterium sp. TY815]MDP7723009.1 NAD-dependent epimerase/dehydratase family protein [Mycobacterium sp. TY814]